jgi:hypothetical protein
MYAYQNQIPVFAGLWSFGAAGDTAVAAVGSVLRIPAGTLVNVGVWTYRRETDPARLAQGIVGGEKWVFHPARMQNDVDMEMKQDVEVAATDQPGIYKIRWKTWVGKLLATLTATDIDTGTVYTKTAGSNQMVEIPAGQAVVVVEAAPGSTALPPGPPVAPPVEPPLVEPSTECPEGQWLSSNGLCVPFVTVVPVAPPATSKPWYKRTGTWLIVCGVVVVGGIAIVATRKSS